MKTDKVEYIFDDMDAFLGEIVKTIAYDLREELFNSTPKQTGWASNNWVPSVGTPNLNTLPPHKRPGVTNRDSSIIDTSEVEQGLVDLETYNTKKGNVYLTNNVDYIEVLNAGSSQQAPANFVGLSIVKTTKKDFKRLQKGFA